MTHVATRQADGVGESVDKAIPGPKYALDEFEALRSPIRIMGASDLSGTRNKATRDKR